MGNENQRRGRAIAQIASAVLFFGALTPSCFFVAQRVNGLYRKLRRSKGQGSEEESAEPPEELTCQISHELLINAVICTKCGTSYDKRTLIRWLRRRQICPVCSQKLHQTTPNTALKEAAKRWMDANPQSEFTVRALESESHSSRSAAIRSLVLKLESGSLSSIRELCKYAVGDNASEDAVTMVDEGLVASVTTVLEGSEGSNDASALFGVGWQVGDALLRLIFAVWNHEPFISTTFEQERPMRMLVDSSLSRLRVDMRCGGDSILPRQAFRDVALQTLQRVTFNAESRCLKFLNLNGRDKMAGILSQKDMSPWRRYLSLKVLWQCSTYHVAGSLSVAVLSEACELRKRVGNEKATELNNFATSALHNLASTGTPVIGEEECAGEMMEMLIRNIDDAEAVEESGRQAGTLRLLLYHSKACRQEAIQKEYINNLSQAMLVSEQNGLGRGGDAAMEIERSTENIVLAIRDLTQHSRPACAHMSSNYPVIRLINRILHTSPNGSLSLPCCLISFDMCQSLRSAPEAELHGLTVDIIIEANLPSGLDSVRRNGSGYAKSIAERAFTSLKDKGVASEGPEM